MSSLINVQIKDAPPERVYVFPRRLTRDEIESNVKELHTIANEEADRNIYCLFDELNSSTALKYEVCFPISHLDTKKYNVADFKIIPRDKVVSCDFNGDFNSLLENIKNLSHYAAQQGFEVKPPYRFLFTLHKRPLISIQPPKFTMEIQIPVANV